MKIRPDSSVFIINPLLSCNATKGTLPTVEAWIRLQNAVSDQGLHCLHEIKIFRTKKKKTYKKLDTLK